MSNAPFTPPVFTEANKARTAGLGTAETTARSARQTVPKWADPCRVVYGNYCDVCSWEQVCQWVAEGPLPAKRKKWGAA